MNISRLMVCLGAVAVSACGAGCGFSGDAADEEFVGADSALLGPTASADAANVYYQIPFNAAPKWVRLFLDTDRNGNTGFRGYGVGADYLVENGNLYRYSGANGAWGWTRIKSVPYTVGSSSAKVTVPRVDIGSPAALDFVTQTDPPLQTSGKITQNLSVSPSPGPAPSTPGTPPGTPPGAPPITGPAFYVSPSGNDSNPGTMAAPWRTIQKAADTLVPGDTAILLDGSYEEREVVFRRSGTSAKPITVMAQNKWKAILSSISGCNPGFSIYASYITVRDIRFSVSPNNANCPTYTSSNVAIRAWNSKNPTPASPSTGYEGFVADGVYVDAGPQRGDGIKSNQDFTIIQGSESGLDIELFGSKNSILRNNVVFGQNLYGISLFVKGGVRNAQVYNNVVRNKFNGGYGIILGGYSCDSCFFDTSTKIEAYNAVAYNNVVVNESGGKLYGLVMQGAKDSAFFNNVVVGGELTMMPGGHNTGFQFPTTNPTFKNNIIACNGSNAISGPANGTVSIDYNDFFNCSGVPSQTHPITGDPRFVSTSSDWHLQAGSPARASGTPISFIGYDGAALDVSRDKNGTVRSAPWDLGIYDQ